MKATYKYTDGANEKFFDVLYIEDDGTMTLEHHNSQRIISWPARLEDGQFGQVVRYGKGSSIPFTDQKGNMRPCWSVLTSEQVAEISTPSPTPSHETAGNTSAMPEGTTEGIIEGTPSTAEATEAAATSPNPRRKRGHRKAEDEYGRVVVPTGAKSPSDATETGTDETSAGDEDTSIITDNGTADDAASGTEGEAVRNLAAILSMMTRSKAVRELAKGVGILAALAIIWQTGLLIPFALLGGIAAGVVK